MNCKLFSHLDFDGTGCAILANIAFDEVSVEYCDYDNINFKVMNFLNDGLLVSLYDYIFITDISVNKEIAEKIEVLVKNYFHNIILLDHHQTALWLSENYKWAFVKEELNGEKTCGTSLFLGLLEFEDYFDHLNDEQKYELYEFTEVVRKYDTWLWTTKYNNDIPKKWNDLMYIYGREKYVQKIVDNIYSEKPIMFSDADKLLLEMKQKEIDEYVESKSKKIISKVIDGHNVGVVFAEKYHSELGNRLAKMYPAYDFIALINMDYSTVSYRGIDKVNLGEFAKMYGGGGHPNAAGGKFNEEMKNIFINMLYNNWTLDFKNS